MTTTEKRRYPLSVVAPIARELALLLGPACERIEIAGSIRRTRPEVADIELVCIPKIETVEVDGEHDIFGHVEKKREEFNLLFRALDGFIPEYIKAGEKYRAFRWPLRQGGETTDFIQVDLFTATSLNWGLIYLIRTGSAAFSQRVVESLARYYRPSYGGAVRRANGIPPKGQSKTGVPFWDDADKERMPVVPTPEEKDVFALARMRDFPPVERSW